MHGDRWTPLNSKKSSPTPSSSVSLSLLLVGDPCSICTITTCVFGMGVTDMD